MSANHTAKACTLPRGDGGVILCPMEKTTGKPTETLARTDEEWRASLTPEQYQIMRKHGTDRAFTSPYWDTKDAATYLCAACGEHLFSSDTKFDSGSGWPSFTQPISAAGVETTTDSTHGMERTEVHCARCAGHLGHVFPDGPAENGLRYCINGTALKKVDR